MGQIFVVFCNFLGGQNQPKHQKQGVLIKGESEMYFKLIKNENELLINRMTETDKIPPKYIFLTLTMLSITIKQNK